MKAPSPLDRPVAAAPEAQAAVDAALLIDDRRGVAPLADGAGGAGPDEGARGGLGATWCDAGIVSSGDSVGAGAGPDGYVSIQLDYLGDWVPPTGGWSVGFLKF